MDFVGRKYSEPSEGDSLVGKYEERECLVVVGVGGAYAREALVMLLMNREISWGGKS